MRIAAIGPAKATDIGQDARMRPGIHLEDGRHMVVIAPTTHPEVFAVQIMMPLEQHAGKPNKRIRKKRAKQQLAEGLVRADVVGDRLCTTMFLSDKHLEVLDVLLGKIDQMGGPEALHASMMKALPNVIDYTDALSA